MNHLENVHKHLVWNLSWTLIDEPRVRASSTTTSSCDLCLSVAGRLYYLPGLLPGESLRSWPSTSTSGLLTRSSHQSDPEAAPRSAPDTRRRLEVELVAEVEVEDSLVLYLDSCC